jgi:hypothetical protein
MSRVSDSKFDRSPANLTAVFRGSLSFSYKNVGMGLKLGLYQFIQHSNSLFIPNHTIQSYVFVSATDSLVKLTTNEQIIAFRGKNGYVNAPQYYVRRPLPVLLIIVIFPARWFQLF